MEKGIDYWPGRRQAMVGRVHLVLPWPIEARESASTIGCRICPTSSWASWDEMSSFGAMTSSATPDLI